VATLQQLPPEGQKAIANSLGFTGDVKDFPKYLMQNQDVANRYSKLEDAFQKQQMFAQQKRMGMAEGGMPMGRFQQLQQTQGVGGYIAPPRMSFQEGGTTTTTVPTTTIPNPDAQPTSMPDSFTPMPVAPLPPGFFPPLPIPPAPEEPTTTKSFETLPTKEQTAPVFAKKTVPIIDQNPTLDDGTANPNYGQPVTDQNEFLEDGTTPNPNYGQPITQEVDPNIGDITAQQAIDPRLPAGTAVEAVGITPTAEQDIASGTGGVTGTVALPTVQATTTTADQQTKTAANVMTASEVTPNVKEALKNVEGAQGQLSEDSKVVAAQQDETSVSQLQAAQGVANVMENPMQREIQEGELISASANAVKAAQFAEQVDAATATPSEKATVKGQLADLTENFDATNPPPWAAGAIRGVQAMMQQRGLGASSMAGQALVQAAMESALPIAQVDASTFAKFEAQNLSNRQQRAMLAAEQRAKFIGQEFDQAFQAKVLNASKIADVANRNFTAEQQVALENSRAAQTMNLQNLSNRQALTMAEASALANMDAANLSNRQQAAVQNANSFLQMDMANLSNTQQADMFVAQQQVQSLFTDQAAKNAAAQFNATSQNQTDQFFANLANTTNQFNATQMNAQSQFNAGQANTIERFNAEINNQRDQFNAQNQLVIAQSNANWRRQIATADTAAINRTNELNAQNLLGISNTAYNNLWQYYGDTMEWAWTSAENERSRVIELAKAQLEADSSTNIQTLKNDYNSSAAFGSLIGKFVTGGIFGGGGLFG